MYSVKMAKGLDNLPMARKIREIVFVDEQEFKYEFDEIDPIAYHIIILKGTEAVACGRYYKKENEDNVFVIGRIAVLKEYRNLHIGSIVVEELERLVIEQGAKIIELSAQIQAKGFYEKLGYQSTGEEHMEEHVNHVLMTKYLQVKLEI